MKKRAVFLLSALAFLMSLFCTAFSFTYAADNKKESMNSVILSPVRTGYSTLDASVDDLLKKITNTGMTTYDKVKACYDHLITQSHEGPYSDDLKSTILMYNEGYYSKRDCDVVFWADFFFNNYSGVGDEYASAFVVLTRALGLESYLITGETKMNSGGYAEHKWACIKINGYYYTFDPKTEFNITSRRSDGKITYGRFFMTDSEAADRLICSDREKDVSLFNFFKKYGFFKISAKTDKPKKIRIGTSIGFEVTAEGYAGEYGLAGVYISEGEKDFFNTDKTERIKDVAFNKDILKWVADKIGTYTLCIVFEDARERQSRVYFCFEIVPRNILTTEKGYAAGISERTVFSELGLNEQQDVIYDANGNELPDTAYIGTGCRLFLESTIYVIYVKGDTDGDGKLTVTDYLIIKKHILNLTELDGAYLKAADADNDGNISSTDYILLKRHLLNLTDIYCL